MPFQRPCVKHQATAVTTFIWTLLLLLLPTHYAWTNQAARAPRPRSVVLRMGLFDFFQNRQNDFIKLSESTQEFGPGPLLILYNCPAGVDDDEIQDMLYDGAPTAHQRKCRIHRIVYEQQPELDMTLQDATELIASGNVPNAADNNELRPIQSDGIPVLLFSGFSTNEMMAVYNILGKEIYEETGGRSSPACAMVVPNAMNKLLRQVLQEIAGDHASAMAME